MTMNFTCSHGQGRVSIVIATNKNNDTLDRCVRSFLAVLEDPEDLIFVDNGSVDHLDVLLREKFHGLTTVRLESNRFFCGGYNAGIKKAMGRGYDFVLISNADTEVVNRGFIKDLLEVAKGWPRAAFIGPLVYFRSRGVIQKTCLQFPNVIREAAIWFPIRLARRYVDRQGMKEQAVEFLNGVCLLCRLEALKEIGLMDENMGGYVEDADWARRARQKGWKSVFAPIPSVIHYEKTEGYEPYSMKTFLLKRNTVLWFLKNGQKGSALLYAGLTIGLGRMRMMCDHSISHKAKHQYFIRRLETAYQGILEDKEYGEWFGPPLGPWDEKA